MEWLILVLVGGLALYALVARRAPIRSRLDHDLVKRRWQEIEQMAASGGSGLRNAVNEADKLLDYAMKSSGFRGQTMGERLKNDGRRFSDLNAVWQAHKLRNTLAHEVEFDLVKSHAKEALDDFKHGLQDLGAL